MQYTATDVGVQEGSPCLELRPLIRSGQASAGLDADTGRSCSWFVRTLAEVIVECWQINKYSVVLAEQRLRLGSGTSAREQRRDCAPPFSLLRKRSNRFRHSMVEQLPNNLAVDLIGAPFAFAHQYHALAPVYGDHISLHATAPMAPDRLRLE